MNIVILGGAGFIGTNLIKTLAVNKKNNITVVDEKDEYFDNIRSFGFDNVFVKILNFNPSGCYDDILNGQDIVYHLVSTTMPTLSNKNVAGEIQNNVIFTTNILEACVRQKIGRVIFISSGGTVYGKNVQCPIKEDSLTNPINSYGLQKLIIEKLLYLYKYIYGLDYRIIRLANPYGPYQRPNGKLGAVTTFIYRALHNEKIEIYGDGSVVRDFVYIDDAVQAIINIAEIKANYQIYNFGSGYGVSILQLLNEIESVFGEKLEVCFEHSRAVDVPVNYLDITRYEKDFGIVQITGLHDGIIKTLNFLKDYDGQIL